MKRFKKWDFAGKWFIRTNRIATRINPDLVLYNLNTFFKFNDKIMH